MDEVNTQTNTFSEEGRIHQVEYAIKSISSAGSVIGVRCSDGIVLLGKNTDDSVSLAQDEKIYRINEKTVGIVGGLYADSNLLINYARVIAQDYLMKYDTEMSPRQVAKAVCKIKQKYTQGGGMRPFGVSFLFAGWDERDEYCMYFTDPSGTMSSFTACAFGEGEKAILPVLDEHSPEKLLDEGLMLAFRGILSVSEGSAILPHTISCSVITRAGGEKTVRALTQEEVAQCLEEAKTQKE
ncbi:20S proteasome subunit alpha 3 [Nematocida major]|uniref:20S proteasome subunit alpha 3 n=1 Tax=Nematocida major TaxID=1912982 RepID=UPI002007DE45|nr:20S proteasome subunit alpha 3 [Nematocida major]KAH9387359.1 20S proteasome subunit alpha 3 [Nematocida major]